MAAIRESIPTHDAAHHLAGVPRFTLFAGTAQQTAVALFSAMMRMHLEYSNVSTYYVEANIPFSDVLVTVKKIAKQRPCIVIFEALNDHRYVALIEALLERQFTVWAGINPFGDSATMQSIQALADAGWQLPTVAQSNHKRSTLQRLGLQGIDTLCGGIEVIDLESDGELRMLSMPSHAYLQEPSFA